MDKNDGEKVKVRRFERISEDLTSSEKTPVQSSEKSLEKSPENSTLIAKSPEPPKKLCIKCKNTEATCDFLVGYQPYFDKWENLLKTNLLRAICENCQVFFKMCVENDSLKKDLELTKKNAEKLSKQKELK